MQDVTLPELARQQKSDRDDFKAYRDSNDRRFSDYIQKEVYTRDFKEVRDDIAEIKDSQKWAMRLIAAQFVALVVALLIWVVQQVPT